MINSVSSAVTRRAGRCVRSRLTIPHKNTKSNNSNNNNRTSISSLSTVTTVLPLPSNDQHDESHQRQRQCQHQPKYQYQYQHKQLCTQTQLQTQLPTQTSMMSIPHRSYSASTKNESTTAVLALGAIAATAKAGQYAVRAYDEWQKSQPEEPEPSADDGNTSKADSNAGTGAGAGAGAGADAGDSTGTGAGAGAGAKKEGKRENIFSSFFNVGGKYYEGGFEEKMTRREAALILGVRESSTPKRIQAAHRKLLILNHPDTGGSTYISGKINEAKDLLIKGNKGRF